MGFRFEDLTHQQALAMFKYVKKTGKVYRISSRYGLNEIGYPNSKGYLVIKHMGARVLLHRLAYFLVTGEWPPDQIDHENTNKSDNRWSNLRVAHTEFNCQNRRKANSNNRLGVLGVMPYQRDPNRFVAQIKPPGTSKMKYLGIFNSVKEASQAYLIEKRKLHAGCTL